MMQHIPTIIDTHGSAEIPDELQKLGRHRICCFTGHRLKDLPDGGSEDSEGMRALRERLELLIRVQLLSGYDVFITGMSSGFDILAADILLNIPDIAPEVRLVCAVPYTGQIREMKTPRERSIYKQALDSAFCTFVFFGKYTDGCYKVRNQFMVNCSSALIGYLKSREKLHSGTAQTVRMAQKAHLATVMIYKDQIDEDLKG